MISSRMTEDPRAHNRPEHGAWPAEQCHDRDLQAEQRAERI